MKTLFIACCLGACSMLMAQHTPSIQETMANYEYEKALQLIEQESPTRPLLYQKGRALKGLGRNEAALNVFEQIITQDSLNPRAYLEAAECSKMLMRTKAALRYYQQALDLNPKNLYTHIQYITQLLAQQKYREALGESSVLSERDSSATVLHLQAQSLEGLNEIAGAVGCYHNIQEKYPSDYLAAAKLGAIYNATEEYPYAIEATEIYRKIDSTNITVNRQNALAYCLNKDYLTAVKRYEDLMGQGDSTFHTCYYAGISYYALEDYYGAHDMLELARVYDPKNVNLLYYLGRACAKTSWKKEGVAYLEEAVELSIPKDSAMTRLYIGLIDSYKMALMHKEQLEALQQRYQNYDKQNHTLLYDMAFIHYYELKNPKEAERYLEAFLKTRPKNDTPAESTIDESGTIVLDKRHYYKAAEKWLKDIRERRKTEDFFKGITDKSQPTS